MPDDLSVQGLTVKDESRYDRNNGVVKERVYTFFLGKHGPFTVRAPLENFDPNYFQTQVTTLRTHLQTLAR